MPNLVVYVPAGLARELEALGVSLEVQRRACHAAVRALAIGGLGSGGVARAVVDPGDAGKRQAAASPVPSPAKEKALRDAQGLRLRAPEDAKAVTEVLAEKRQFRPDPKRK